MDEVLRQLPIAKGARFDSFRSEQERKDSCSAGTREGVLEAIQEWARSVDEAREHIFWLNGLAGTGKSTIATTIAKWARKEGILGGSFFFAREVAELNSPALIFPTLASQIARFDKQYKRALYDTLLEDKDIASANLTTQFDRLILGPLSTCHEGRPILIMLDALDECSPEGDVKEMIRILLRSGVGLQGRKLRIFTTSRPEAHIRFMFTSKNGIGRHEKVILHEIDDKIARNDIQTYLKSEFVKMTSGTRDLGEFPKNWPSSEQFDKLLDHCGKFFAYAVTAVRFIGDEGVCDPVSQLDEILRMKDNPHVTDGTNPYLVLDNLYLGVLQQAASKNPRNTERIRHIIATVVLLRSPLSIADLAVFLSMTSDSIRKTLRHLHSVVLVPDGSKESIRFFHQSFPDYLRDKARCANKQFFVDVSMHENFMALQCMDANGKTYFGRNFRSVVAYAIQHWPSHLRSGSGHDLHHEPAKGSIQLTMAGDELKNIFGETQEAVLTTVRNWATCGDNGQKHIFWLYELEDTGASSIASTIAKWAHEKGMFGASFFFSNSFPAGVKELEDPRYVFPTLASQLARYRPQYKHALYNILLKDEDLASADLQSQFDGLVRQPLSSCHWHGEQPILLVLHRPELCTGTRFGRDTRDLQEMLRILLQFYVPGLEGPKLRIFIVSTSKPDFMFKPMEGEMYHENVIFHDFHENMERNDIRAYLEGEIARISRDLLKLPEGWPPSGQVSKLLDRCGKFLAYAATAIRFIDDKRVCDPVGQLREILDTTESPHGNDGTRPTLELDKLYLGLLRRATSKNPWLVPQEEHAENIRCVIATILCLRDQPAIDMLADFLSMTLCAVRNTLESLRSVILVPDSDIEPVRFFHSSFPDFIQDKARCTDGRFLIDVPTHEYFMALQCMTAMRHALASFHPLQGPIGNYAFSHWPSHVQLGTFYDLGDKLVQDLIWFTGDGFAIQYSYGFTGSFFEEDREIISFLRSLVV